jgi:hypothetical protein
MSASIGASVQPAGVPGEPAPAHEHVWGLMRFELVDDRPTVRQQCETCGFVRGYRAWERYWTPGEDEVRR